MDHVLAIGIVLTSTGLIGYVLGIAVSYPGRAFAVAVVMVGVTLTSIGLWGAGGTRR